MAEAARGFALHADGGERLQFGDVTISSGPRRRPPAVRSTLFEEVPPLVDTPLHVHAHEDELFYILEGEHVIEVGDEEFQVGPGDMVFAPRGVPHSQRRVVPGVGRLLVMTSPGGPGGLLPRAGAAETRGHARAGGLRGRLGAVRHHLALSSRLRPRFLPSVSDVTERWPGDLHNSASRR